MANRIIIGAQWGDEGKAKIVDYLTEHSDIVVRFQGGANAGHTVIVKGTKFIFHLIPAGIMHPGKECVIGNGVVLDPAQFLKELKEISDKGLDYAGRVFLSDRATIVMPYHIALDQLREKMRGNSKIGTTGRGIGPAYMDKVGRWGIRVGDLLSVHALSEKVTMNLEEKNALITKVFGEKPFNAEKLIADYLAFGEQLKPYITDTSVFLAKAAQNGKNLLFEGAQGTMLDVDHGTYPFVTSSNTIAGSACCGSGIGPTHIHSVIGITKAYTTRVGNGPFPTELTDEMGERIRNVGGEYGATTGRPRRCGWFDAVQMKKAHQLNGFTSLAITKLDVLDSFPKMRICTSYTLNGETIDTFPGNIDECAAVTPVYEEMDGWNCSTSAAREFSDLPEKAQRYLERLSQLVGVPMSLVSVGPERDQTIVNSDF
ncbi:MAG: adenylosuccinate synthase [Candidatus Raymondbacteria bacterium RifOxyA12_full_50_37]|uniref:Adenylosuccinate synthetase n=1 Tax=Candidatus Raymondbacteria bacterium RIFOXYD12_FULL_49_13 TaxID=1817890 RepID=A0A1F7FB72_UNCRA|nr:MAG: adenylosuccinate synthase [Candidatus Raymondbacteria bacterium RifOxyA12_full_50_37]OGJ92602.1 MAG: adenylosuccinate synthase [Candidatus Raymondbacteria bacterium RIFOXYA2_FULL_49_16]OGJ97956.1 MAG: adenylosuccinate synthase [Candidatus Raymondbacteria bacterium RIFOXYC2_FULL_50_21]OGK02054.1 MAG: adenylosuccinate synthase [Candidatus Raymondbacteria bacterium RifOxyC12_full_50_8]OGK03737.1 MAG: adenylosuccinate synthase [Candidatus Raymondbacteria bacterium RIFOXYD12_FULL_49_13]OGP4